ncbi:hypothetical protein BJ508DRAFT_310731 [Ascobolus immersus RN42]|uniref:Uncharacterized protein n=1 Tax=Ascobolus immersus RN42 TaxID=1160509 RepID=A0A3N4HW85_ASCIM|nr:hypothetical protein BJ508DRAFT_310731 [Ascobolus immersus RN42]
MLSICYQLQYWSTNNHSATRIIWTSGPGKMPYKLEIPFDASSFHSNHGPFCSNPLFPGEDLTSLRAAVTAGYREFTILNNSEQAHINQGTPTLLAQVGQPPNVLSLVPDPRFYTPSATQNSTVSADLPRIFCWSYEGFGHDNTLIANDEADSGLNILSSIITSTPGTSPRMTMSQRKSDGETVGDSGGLDSGESDRTVLSADEDSELDTETVSGEDLDYNSDSDNSNISGSSLDTVIINRRT